MKKPSSNIPATLADILAETGIIDREELRKALKLEENSNLSLGQILLKKGQLSEKDLLQALSRLHQIEYKEKLEAANMDTILERVPVRFVQKYRIVPYRLDKGRLSVAMTDPTMVHPLDELRLMWIGTEVVNQLAPEAEILRVIHQFYDKTGHDDGSDVGLQEGLQFLEDIDDLQGSIDLANEAPIIKMVNVILSNAVSERASDIHIEPMEKELVVRYRVDGVLHRVLTPPRSIQSGIISRIKIMAGLNIAENRLPQDGRIKIRFSAKDIDIRVSSLPSQFGERLVLRLLNKTDTKFSLANIGFEPDTRAEFEQLIKQTNGIILITGPTGSGKTSTLYAALTEVKSEYTNIITVEDPVEYQIDGISQVQAHQKIGLTFAEGLRSILRQDPDIIMVGEIRDEETARVAIQASLTGHLVFSTLHTNDAPSAVTRLLDMGIEPYLITSTARGFMAQRLVRQLCPHCKKAVKVSSAVLARHRNGRKSRGKGGKTLKIYEARGCSECMNTGYRGRTGIYELLVLTDVLREKILKNPSLDELRRAATAAGMISLRDAALDKVEQGITTLEEALRMT